MEKPKTKEELINNLMEEYQKQFFEENGFIMSGQQKRMLKKKVEKLVERRLKSYM